MTLYQNGVHWRIRKRGKIVNLIKFMRELVVEVLRMKDFDNTDENIDTVAERFADKLSRERGWLPDETKD